MEEDQTCWICLCGTDGLDIGEEDQCVRVCACPRVCHKRCLGRWQLQNAGKKEEKYCRFCQQRYPDWRNSLTPGEITPSTPVMAVSVRGKVYKLRVRSGPEGKEDFKRQIRQLLGFTQDMDFDVIFECKTPHNGAEKVQLHGFEAFEAASWCAAVSAAKRKKAKQEAAARAAAAAAAAGASGGGLTPMASCPAALTMPGDSSSSSSGSSGGAAAAGGSNDGSSSDGGGPDMVPGGAHPDVEGSIAPSAFATATATAAVTGVSGCPAGTHSLNSAMSEPVPALSTLHPPSSSTSSSGLGMFGLQPSAAGGASASPAAIGLLQPAGSSLPHAIIEEAVAAGGLGGEADGSPSASSPQLQPSPSSSMTHGLSTVGGSRPSAFARQSRQQQQQQQYHQGVGGSSSSGSRRSSSCPGEGAASASAGGGASGSRRHHHNSGGGRGYSVAHPAGRASYSSGVSGLQGSMSVPIGGSSRGSSRDGSQGGEGGEGGEEGDKRGKVGRWLRRVLHLEGPWRGAMPAGVFMGVV